MFVKRHNFDREFQKLINIRFQIRAYGWEKCWKLINVRRTFIWNPKVHFFWHFNSTIVFTESACLNWECRLLNSDARVSMCVVLLGKQFLTDAPEMHNFIKNKHWESRLKVSIAGCYKVSEKSELFRHELFLPRYSSVATLA